MANASDVIGIMVVSTAINTIHTQKSKGWSAVPPELFGAAGLLLIFVGIGQFLDWRLARVLAWIHLLATVLTNGLPAVEFMTRLFGQQRPTSKTEKE